MVEKVKANHFPHGGAALLFLFDEAMHCGVETGIEGALNVLLELQHLWRWREVISGPWPPVPRRPFEGGKMGPRRHRSTVVHHLLKSIACMTAKYGLDEDEQEAVMRGGEAIARQYTHMRETDHRRVRHPLGQVQSEHAGMLVALRERLVVED